MKRIISGAHNLFRGFVSLCCLLFFLLLFSGTSVSQIFPSEKSKLQGLYLDGISTEEFPGKKMIVYLEVPETGPDSFFILLRDASLNEEDFIRGREDSEIKMTVFGGLHALIDFGPLDKPPPILMNAGNKIQITSYDSNGKADVLSSVRLMDGLKNEEKDSRIFRIQLEIKGNDGNSFRIAASPFADLLEPVDGASFFVHHLHCLFPDAPSVSRIQIRAESNTSEMSLHKFDYTSGGANRVTEPARKGLVLKPGIENEWVSDTIILKPKEKGSKITWEFIRSSSPPREHAFITAGDGRGGCLRIYTD